MLSLKQKNDKMTLRYLVAGTLTFFMLIASLLGQTQTKKICISIDDLPTVPYSFRSAHFQWEIIDGLVKTLTSEDVPAIGYINEGKLYKEGILDSFQVKMLRHWLANGLDIGNHTFSHMNYHRTTFEEFTADFLAGEKITRPLVKAYNKELKFFRHPYLRMGLRAGHADSLKNFLEYHGYAQAPVTMDNEEYLFAFAYSRAMKKRDETLMARIGTDYVQYMKEKAIYFDRQARKLIGRPVNHILLLHANALNAEYLDELIAMYRESGYTFISQEAALKDPIYEEQITRFGDWGISWIDQIALSRGEGGSFFKDDPKTPSYIYELTR